MRVLQRFCTQNKLNQINSKALAINFPQSYFKPLEWKESIDIKTLVPNFFATTNAFELLELKDEYKLKSENQQFNSLTNTYSQLKIPLKSNDQLRLQFTKLSTKYVRIGRLLEVLDSLVGMVAYKHCYTDLLSRTTTIATLGVYDFMIFTNEIDYASDLTMNTYVTYVGKTSIEINNDIYQENELAASVTFVMVARSAENYGQSKVVPQLMEEQIPFIKDICFVRKELGKRNQFKRIQESNRQFESPNLEESQVLHKIMMANKESGITMNSTRIEKNTLMHSQDRNLHGKAFGGNIMKEILELGWLVGYKYVNGGMVRIIHIFDVTFLAPIKIGSAISYSSKLCYTEGKTMIIQVQVDVHNYKDGKLEIKKTTEVFLAMIAENDVQEVVPKTYEEGIYYLHGKRLMQKFKGF